MRNYDTTNRDKQREETEKRILEAAIVHFGKLGYTHTIMRNITKDAGVAYGLISRYYGTKEKLLTEAYVYALQNTDVYIYSWLPFSERIRRYEEDVYFLHLISADDLL
ncbi:MAG: TetR/AcrR family transcriptional regulator [Clostridiales bacterium]|nr:TetR/AcrR family transcriptional regulator [Clostridiales bacterium]